MTNEISPEGSEKDSTTDTEDSEMRIALSTPESAPIRETSKRNQPTPYKSFDPFKRLSQLWHDPKREHARWTDKAIVLLTFGIVFLAFMQWREMHESGAQTDRIISADERIAAAMENSVSQAKSSFDAANKQAILSQRAWISIGVHLQDPAKKEKALPANPLKPGTIIDLRSTIKNTGRTPAINVRSVGQRTGIHRSEDGTYPYPSFEHFALLPLENLNPDGELYGDMLLPFTQQDKQLIDSGKVRVYFYGRIEYEDVFGGRHWRNFCTFLLPSGAFAMCQQYNDIDRPN